MYRAIIAVALLVVNGCGDDSSSSDAPLTPESYVAVPIWSDRYDSGEGNASGLDFPERLIAANGVVVASGSGGAASAQRPAIVRALDGGTGSLLWEDSFDGADCNSWAYEMAVIHDRLVVGAVHCQSEGLRVYDLRTGSLLWESMQDDPRYPTPPIVLGVGSRVAAIDRDVIGLTIRMHDPSDGSVIWEHYEPGAIYPSACSDDSALVVASFDAEGRQHSRVRAYDPSTGEQLWETIGIREGTYTLAVGYGVLVSYATPRAGTGFPRLVARDLATGKVLWTHRGPHPGGIKGVTVDRDRVYVAGLELIPGGWNESSRTRFWVASYSKIDGKPLWERRHRAMRTDEQAQWVALDGDRLLVGGSQMQLRAYHAATGTVLEEIFPGELRGIGRDIATNGRNFYSLAAALEPGAESYEQQDFLVRAYREVVK